MGSPGGGPAPGWYPDPAGSGSQRYWTGTEWGPTAPVTESPKRQPRSPLKVALVTAVVLFVVLGIAAAIDDKPDRSSSAASTTSSAASSWMTPTSTVPPGPSPQDLDPANYAALDDRDFAILVKNPDGAIGRKVIVYGKVTQFDAATGQSDFRADTGPELPNRRNQYEQNTIVHAEDPTIVADVVEGDLVELYVEVYGSYSYDTSMGGRTTVPRFTAYIVNRLNSR